jgi:AcrR family transcriptional regulator
MKNTRQLILDQALAIAMEDGLQSVTQTGVAHAVGIRQSLLTYYFPRKSDLLVALLESSHRDAAKPRTRSSGLSDDNENPAAGLALVEKLFLDTKKISFFLGFVGQAMDDIELQKILSQHLAVFEKELAKQLGRQPGDEAVQSFLDHLRGACLRLILEKKNVYKEKLDIKKIARLHGLL